MLIPSPKPADPCPAKKGISYQFRDPVLLDENDQAFDRLSAHHPPKDFVPELFAEGAGDFNLGSRYSRSLSIISPSISKMIAFTAMFFSEHIPSILFEVISEHKSPEDAAHIDGLVLHDNASFVIAFHQKSRRFPSRAG